MGVMAHVICWAKRPLLGGSDVRDRQVSAQAVYKREIEGEHWTKLTVEQ